ncbi:MAG: flagellar export protein FliJ [Desulfotalea sp.]
MKPFSLETVLKHRKRLQDEAQTRLVNARKGRDLVEQRLREQKTVYKQAIREFEEIKSQSIDIPSMQRYEYQISHINEDIKKIEKNLKIKEKLVISERNHLSQKAKDYKIMCQLKDKQNTAWRQYVAKKEAAFLDEIAVMRHNKEVM